MLRLDTRRVGPAIDDYIGMAEAIVGAFGTIPQRGVQKATNFLTTAIKSTIRRAGLIRTGGYRRSVRPETQPIRRNGFDVAYEGIVGTNRAYAPLIERGTRPHVIEPRVKRVLAWSKTGFGSPRRFARRVQHPGTRAYQVFSGTQREQSGTIFQIVRDEAAQVAAEA